MKILFINLSSQIGGAELSLFDFLKKIDKKIFTPIVLCNSEGEFFQQVDNFKIRKILIKGLNYRAISKKLGNRRIINPLAVFWNTVFFIPFIIKLIQVIKKEEISLIHTNSRYSHIYGGIAGKLIGVPVVWHIHDIYYQKIGIWIMNKLALMLPERIIVNSKTTGTIFTGNPKIRVVYNGVDLDNFKKSNESKSIFCKKFGLKRNTKKIAIISRITEQKGHEYFLKAIPSIIKDFPDTKFLIVGNSLLEEKDFLEQLKELIKNLDISHKVVFTGFREDVPQIINFLDIIVHCSTHEESFGRIIIEAMAATKPVVATNIGASAEIIEDGVDGLLIPPKDSRAIENAIKELLSNPQKMKFLGENGRRKVERCFSSESYYKNIIKVYSEIVGDTFNS